MFDAWHGPWGRQCPCCHLIVGRVRCLDLRSHPPRPRLPGPAWASHHTPQCGLQHWAWAWLLQCPVICTHNYLCLFVCVSVWGRPGLGSVSMSTCKQNFVSQFSPLITLHCQSGSSGSCACTYCTPVHAALYTSYHGKTEASIKTHAYQLQLSALFTAESSHAYKAILLISKVLDIEKKWTKKQKRVLNGQKA